MVYYEEGGGVLVGMRHPFLVLKYQISFDAPQAGTHLLDLQKCCCLHCFIAQSLIPTYTHLLLGEVPKGLSSSYYRRPQGRDTNQSAEEESKCTELLTYEIDNIRKGKIPIHVI